MAEVRVLTHSSIRIAGKDRIIYFDPFEVREALHDADVVFVTHDHFDHYSLKDIEKVSKENTVLVVPESILKKVKDARKFVCGIVSVKPKETTIVSDIPVEAVPAYNVLKPFHPKMAGYLGYVVTVDRTRYYVAGDTDDTKDAYAVQCDTALLPVGGKYTMDAKEAAALANAILPSIVIPTHYGSVAGEESAGETFRKLVSPGIRAEILKEY